MILPRVRAQLGPLAALLCLLAGLVLLVLLPGAPRPSGWFAYAPLQSGGPSTASVLVLTRQQCVAVALLLGGALLAAATAGHRLGRSARTGG